jgi:hypothetical protein
MNTLTHPRTSERKEVERIAALWEIETARERDKRKSATSISPGGIINAVAKFERLARQGRIDHASVRETIYDILISCGQSPSDAVTHRTWCGNWKIGKLEKWGWLREDPR